MAVSIIEYRKALLALAEALKLERTDITRDATIQRFEFCVELAWKTARKIMGTNSSAPKAVIREMAQNGFIEDVVFWLEAIDRRNDSSHTYNEDLADIVYDFAENFLPQATKLLKNMEDQCLD